MSSLRKTLVAGSSTPTSGARKAFKSPFRSVTSLNVESQNKSLSNIDMPVKCNTTPNVANVDREDSMSTSNDISSNNCSTPQRNQGGIKRKTTSGSLTKKFMKTPFKSPSAIVQCPKTLDELVEREAALDIEIDGLQQKGYRVEDLQVYIDQLHKYNEIKDAAQIVMGRIAEMDQISLKEVHKRFGANDLD